MRIRYYLLSTLTTLFCVNIRPIFAQEIKIFENPSNNHRYFLTPVMSWVEAKYFAQEMGGHLVTINNSAENQWLMDTFTTSETDFLWIGINDRYSENNFCWLGDDHSDYQNWAMGEPNNNPKRGGEDFGVLNGQANPFARPAGFMERCS